jgi:hypothetical protein
MSVDTKILFDHKVRLDDIVKVMAILVGNKPEKSFFDHSDGWSTRVNGAKIEKTCVVGMYYIVIKPPKGQTLVDGEKEHHGSFHFETGIGPSDDFGDHMILGKGLYVGATAFWIAMGKRLVDFFGGYMQYNDCDADTKIDYMQKMPPYASASNGKPWYELQEAMLNLHPLFKGEYEEADKYAAYKIGK